MIAERVEAVRERISNAMASAGRFDKVRLLAVSKNHSAGEVAEAVTAGITAVGENRVQEAKAKREAYVGPPAEWHLIGHLQVNKVRQAVPIFDLIHSVDSRRVLEEIERVAAKADKVQEILLQVNIAREASKSGMDVEEFPELRDLAATLPHVRVRGLMCIAPYGENPETARPVFKVAYALFDDMKRYFPEGQVTCLSMGMTNDFEVALEEGATIVRVGTAIFGERDYDREV